MDGQKGSGKYIVFGQNNLTKQYNTPTLHAEIDAYKKLPRYYMSLDLDMVVVRFSKEGKLCQSRPCYHCLKALTESGISIKNVYYSKDDDMHKEKFSNMLNSELTCMTSGMRHKHNMQK
jgi:deoxycytidylate deaminase